MEQFNLDKWLQDKSRKVVTRLGKPVRIVCWDAPTKNPIYGFVEGDDVITSWRKDGRFSNLIDSVDLFFADEEEELTDFEKVLKEIIEDAQNGYYTEEESFDFWKDRLLDLARKELKNNDWRQSLMAYKTPYEQGKQDVLKDFPKWKKATEHKDLEKHIAILEEDKVLLSNYLEEGDYYIDLEDLKTLPKEK